MRLRSLLLDVFVVLACCHLLEAGPVNADGFAPLVDPEIRRAIAEGSARVLVEIRLPRATMREGDLSPQNTAASRPDAIAAVQKDVVSRLPRTHFSLLRRFETVPFLALDIDADALTALENMGDLVVRVVPDRTMAPAPRP